MRRAPPQGSAQRATLGSVIERLWRSNLLGGLPEPPTYADGTDKAPAADFFLSTGEGIEGKGLASC